jgi:hypothetical protein
MQDTTDQLRTAVFREPPMSIANGLNSVLRSETSMISIISRSVLSQLELLAPDPVHAGGEAKDAHEGTGGLLVARRHGPPLLQPAPEPFDAVAVGVGPGRADDRGLVAPGRDGGRAPVSQAWSRGAASWSG